MAGVIELEGGVQLRVDGTDRRTRTRVDIFRGDEKIGSLPAGPSSLVRSLLGGPTSAKEYGTRSGVFELVQTMDFARSGSAERKGSVQVASIIANKLYRNEELGINLCVDARMTKVILESVVRIEPQPPWWTSSGGGSEPGVTGSPAARTDPNLLDALDRWSSSRHHPFRELLRGRKAIGTDFRLACVFGSGRAFEGREKTARTPGLLTDALAVAEIVHVLSALCAAAGVGFQVRSLFDLDLIQDLQDWEDWDLLCTGFGDVCEGTAVLMEEARAAGFAIPMARNDRTSHFDFNGQPYEEDNEAMLAWFPRVGNTSRIGIVAAGNWAFGTAGAMTALLDALIGREHRVG